MANRGYCFNIEVVFVFVFLAFDFEVMGGNSKRIKEMGGNSLNMKIKLKLPQLIPYKDAIIPIIYQAY